MSDRPKPRPNRKRQLVGLLLVSVLVCYPLSVAPMAYAVGRGWVPRWAVRPSYLFFQPARFTLRFIPAGDGNSLAYHYAGWSIKWMDRGERDALAH